MQAEACFEKSDSFVVTNGDGHVSSKFVASVANKWNVITCSLILLM